MSAIKLHHGLISRFQGPYATGELLGDGFLISDGLIISRGSLFAGSHQLANGESLWNGNGFLTTGLMLSESPLMSDAVDISTDAIVLTADVLTDPVLSGGRSITTPSTYDGILFTNGVQLSTGQTLANNSFIDSGQLTGDGILMGHGD